jgi:integrase
MARQSKAWFRKASNSWYCTLNGRKVSLGVQGAANEREAVKAWHRLLGGLPLEAPQKPLPTPPVESQAEGKAVSVQSVIDGFLADSVGRVLVETTRVWRQHLAPFAERYGDRPAVSLTATEAEALTRKPTWTQTYRSNILSTLITAFRWAERERLIDRSPLHGIRKPPKASRGAKAIVTADAHARLVQTADASFGAFLQLLWLTGARPGEIAGLQAEDVDAVQGVAVLAEHKTAHLGKRRILFLSTEAVAILRERIALHPDGLLFRGVKGRMTPTAIGCRLRRLCVKAGVKNCIAYGYRHTFATDALANGVPDAQVSALLGHSGTAMLHKHYAHLGARARVLKDALGKVR